MTLQEQIKIDFAEYCDEYKMLPNYVEVDVCFDDGDIAYSEIIALHEYDADVDPDDAIFFYCHGLKDLCALCDSNNGGDFVIISCGGFSDKI